MSKIKQYLSEDVDITDSREADYGEDSPTLDDLYINQLITTVRALEGQCMSGYLPELTEIHNRIMKLQFDAEKAPF